MGNGAGPQLGHDGHSLGICTYGSRAIHQRHTSAASYSS
ncbi:hypothetical protein T261_3641 [Streptomyces lydicus]|nr:hypothetical protein T261_3641 [Streptomyces lydicus]